MPEIKSLTISTRKWLHGGRRGPYRAALLDLDTQRMCCLGFLGIACGLKPDDILNVGTPACVDTKHKKIWPKAARPRGGNNTAWVKAAIRINDGESEIKGKLSLEQRKRALRKHFRSIGIALRFTP